MELLAPAGNLENFQAALAAGADAVYVGAPGFNARNLARDLRLEEIGAMIRYCHDRGKRLYVAANSLILEKELAAVIEALALLESLQPDALIVQDLGLIHLIRNYFPNLALHASTLMTAHNGDAVRMLSAMGCQRAVLARELTLKEISPLVSESDIEIEVFVHGAMCFSFSGLCLFSSYLGGKSGLRGRCVQPCRRRYSWQGRGQKGREGGKPAPRGSYLFSMNDLGGLEVVPELRRMGIAALKIEGRLRSAQYVSQVVRAYRLVLDASENNLDEAMAQAKTCIDHAMGRTVSSGFFLSPQPKGAITPHHSGNIGSHLGRLKAIELHNGIPHGILGLKEPVEVGDRLRLHFESSGERQAFTLKGLLVNNRAVDGAKAGTTVMISLPEGASDDGRIELYKIDVRSESGNAPGEDLAIGTVKRELTRSGEKLRSRIKSIQDHVQGACIFDEGLSSGHRKLPGVQKRSGGQGLPLEWWLKTDSPKVVLGRLPFAPDRLLLPLDKTMISQASEIRRFLGQQVRTVIWGLPPVLIGPELGRMRKHIALLIRSGFKSFQIGHLSQIALFKGERLHLYGDYTINLLNSQAIALAGQTGLEAVQLSPEADRFLLRDIIQGYKKPMDSIRGKRHSAEPRVRVGLTIYGAPALFTARLAADHFYYDRVLVSPKMESFIIRKREGYTQTFPARPFSLIPYGRELKEVGLDYAVVDITGLDTNKKELQELADRIAEKGRFAKLPTFNYLGKLD
jgi:U32 family peptidase